MNKFLSYKTTATGSRFDYEIIKINDDGLVRAGDAIIHYQNGQIIETSNDFFLHEVTDNYEFELYDLP